jgi:hypothetical protein
MEFGEYDPAFLRNIVLPFSTLMMEAADSSEALHPYTKLHGVISQKTIPNCDTTVRT